MIDHTHAADLQSWVTSANGHAAFPIQNLPLGIFSPPGGGPRAGIAIGDYIVDIKAIPDILPIDLQAALNQTRLNSFFALPTALRRELRKAMSASLSDLAFQAAVEPALHPMETCELHLPATIGDYTDFYVGIHHATHVGQLFRPDNPLLPNYKYVPIGYHGRASSIRPSGVPVVRPVGQTKGPQDSEPRFGPTRRLDYELELGLWIGEGNALGEPIPIGQAADHIAGFCLLNDWSARDLQAWEYQPLGPFLSKSFHSTISPWVVTAEAMAPFRIAQPARPDGDPAPLPYLADADDQAHGALGVMLSVYLLSAAMRDAGMAPMRLSQGPASNLYWTVQQIVTHQASNGCNMMPGDLLGTGTISAPTRDGFGSLLELSVGGKEPLSLPTGETRAFLADGDEIILQAVAQADGFVPIGFGECRAQVLPARA